MTDRSIKKVFKACDSKLLEILPSVYTIIYNFNNLLKRKQSSRKTSIVCHRLNRQEDVSQAAFMHMTVVQKLQTSFFILIIIIYYKMEKISTIRYALLLEEY